MGRALHADGRLPWVSLLLAPARCARTLKPGMACILPSSVSRAGETFKHFDLKWVDYDAGGWQRGFRRWPQMCSRHRRPGVCLDPGLRRITSMGTRAGSSALM